jgi:hypothetical protein
LLGACTAQIYSVPDQPIAVSGKTLSRQDVRMAINNGATHMGWQVKDESPNTILATLDLRTHHAVVEITYTDHNYSIAYKDSANLNYDGTYIHRNYNGWVHNLQTAINSSLNAR